MTEPSRTNRLSGLLCGTLLSVVLLGASPAYAHNVVEDRSPPPDSSVTESPVAISLTSDDVFLDLGGEARGFGVVVRDSTGLYYGNGCVDVSEQTMTASAELGGSGTYEIIYQFVSADGHSLSESYEFVFEPGPEHTAAKGYDTPAECGVPRDPSVREPLQVTEPTPAEDPVAEDSPRDPTLIVGFVSLVSIAVVIWVVRRHRQRRDAT
jgi:copper resistance protein C